MTNDPAHECRLCGSKKIDPPIQIREMMFGTRELFAYIRCQTCDTLQIASIPEDLGQYYPPDYYSFSPLTSKPTLRQRLRGWLKPDPMPQWLSGVNKRSAILDIGSGGGVLLHQMHYWGFRTLVGYDPFLDDAKILPNGIELTNIEPNDSFDLVMMHHALEHVPDPAASLRKARLFARPGGRIVIRIPVRQGHVWRTYGKDWAHLDPPRHLYLWTVDGFISFATKNGLKVSDWGFDGTLFSLIYSDLYAQDIAMNGNRSDAPQLTQERVAALNRQAILLNETGEGDCAWFVLEPSD